MTLPKTTKTTKQKHLKQAKTLANPMEIKGDGALPQTTKTTKQKQPKPHKPPKTSKSDGNQQKW
jgi:hypothetical protein